MVRDKREGRLAGIRKSELTTPPAPNTMNDTNTTAATALPPSHVDSPLYDKWLAIVIKVEAEVGIRSYAEFIADTEVGNQN